MTQNLKPLINQKIAQAWRGYGLYISFNLGEITLEKYFVEHENKMYEREHHEVSLNVESEWAFIKDTEEIIATDSPKEDLELFDAIDKFLLKNFKPNDVSITDFDKQENVTIVTFSNGYKLEMNNKEGDEEGWFVLKDDYHKTKKDNQ